MEQLAIQEKLSAAFGDQVGEWHAMKGSAYATKFGSYLDVKNVDYLRDVCLYMRDQPELQFDNLMLLSTLDNGDKTLSAVYHLESTVHRHVFALKVTVSVDLARVPSVTNIWTSANWHEREGWDMMGIEFTGHPDLRRILLDEDYPGHPLRKDFKVPEFYHGMKVPY
jgi:NADH-quinone oxidoreductase subunit C